MERFPQPALFDRATVMLGHPDARMRLTAAKVLGKIGDRRAIAPLITLFGDRGAVGSELVASAAARSVGQLADAGTIDHLLVMLGHERADRRALAAMALSVKPDPRSLGALIERLLDPSLDVRHYATIALGLLRDERAIAPLIALMREGAIREKAKGKWELLGGRERLPRDQSSESDVERGIPESQRPVMTANVLRGAIFSALTRIGSPLAIEPLFEEVQSSSAIDERVLEALVVLRAPGLGDFLLQALSRSDEEARRPIIRTLVRLRDQRVGSVLLPIARTPTEGRQQIYALIDYAIVVGEEAVPVLREALSSDDQELREAAIARLARLRPELDQKLLSRDFVVPDFDFDRNEPGAWIDPQRTITLVRARRAADKLDLSLDEVRTRYEAMAADLGLKLRMN